MQENRFEAGKILYSYEAERVYETRFGIKGGEPKLVEWVIIRETPKGVWIHRKVDPSNPVFQKWTSKTATRRIAYPDKESAWNSFMMKRERYVEHCNRRLEYAREQLVKAQRADAADVIEPHTWYTNTYSV